MLDNRIVAKFWERVVQTAGCWSWTGKKHHTGYGLIRGRMGKVRYELLAHRVSWEIHNGSIPFKKHVLHKCDNPVCSNPLHLFIGTQQDNIADMLIKGRSSVQKFSARDIIQIRKIWELKLMSIARLAKAYDTKYETIQRIVRSKTWTFVK